MLKVNPKVGEYVVANQDESSDEGQYLTEGETYEVVGIGHMSANTYHLDDNGNRCYIDDESWELYDLAETKQRVSIGLTGIEIDGRRYVEEPTNVSIHLSVMTDSKNLLKVLDSLHDDIEKLLEEKYRVFK